MIFSHLIFIFSYFSFEIFIFNQEIIHKNSHIHPEIGENLVTKLMQCTYLSEYDKIACSAVYGYDSEAEYAKAVSSIGK